MDRQLQQRAVSVAGRLSTVARGASERIHALQQAILAEQAKRKEKEERLLKGRLSRARAGLRRLLAFANSPSIRRIMKTHERLGENSLLFYEDRWDVIGTSPKSHLSFAIGSRGIVITMTNSCHVTDSVSAVFPYKGREVTVDSEFGGRRGNTWVSSPEEILNFMVAGTMTSLYKTSEESGTAFRVLAAWSRPAPFERVATRFLEDLESRLRRTRVV
jgi:hypothetical protein